MGRCVSPQLQPGDMDATNPDNVDTIHPDKPKKKRSNYKKLLKPWADDEAETPESPRRYVPQSIEYFIANTNFSRIELQSLYRNFKNECPTGIVNEDTFKAICCQFFPYGDAKSYAHFVFLAFDVNEEGHIDFEQFVVGLSTLLRGSLQDRLKWIFRLYDVNHDGVISKEEMLMVVKSLYKMLGSSVTPPLNDRTYVTHTERIFNKFNTNQEGHITMQILRCLLKRRIDHHVDEYLRQRYLNSLCSGDFPPKLKGPNQAWRDDVAVTSSGCQHSSNCMSL